MANTSDTDFQTRSDGTPEFKPDPMLRHTVRQLRESKDIGHNALADVLEQSSVSTKNLEYQNRELVTIKTQSRENGITIAMLKELQLETVVDQHRTLFAAYTIWSQWRRVIKWVCPPLILAGLATLGKHIADKFFP